MTFRDAIAASPLLFPYAEDPSNDTVQLVELTEQDYAQASFLDRRLPLRIDVPIWLRWSDVREVACKLPRRCHFIFHISHCGSTLVSRMLGHLPAFFCLREPAILRTLHKTHTDPSNYRDRAAHYLALWSRVYHPHQVAVIKATSFVSEHGVELMDLVPGSRGLLLFLPLGEFLPGLLDGTLHDVMNEAAARTARLQQRLQTTITCQSPGEWVAMTWLCEMLSLDSIASRLGTRTHWLNFDDFLREPLIILPQLAGFFTSINDPPSETDVDAAALELFCYSKAPTIPFNANDRHSRLEQSRRANQQEIARGLDWIRRLFDTHACPTIARWASVDKWNASINQVCDHQGQF